MDALGGAAEALRLRYTKKDFQLADRHRALPITPISTMYWTLYDGWRYDKSGEVPHDLPSFPLAQDRLRELRARLKRCSQLRCGGSTARHRAVPRRRRPEEHADQPHHRDARPGRSRVGRAA